MLCKSSMQVRCGIAMSSLCASSLMAAQAQAQGSAPVPGTETLETPYEELVPPQPEPAVPPPARPAPAEAAPRSPSKPVSRPSRASAPVATKADTRPLGPIRARRRLALTGELGWNGIAGFGPVLTYHADPHLSFDLGGGASLFGWKAGLRTRYNFLKTPFTPFVGLGLNATTGLGELTMNAADDPHGDPNRDPVTVDLKPSYLAQTTLGFDFVHRRGFNMIGCLGYAFLLNEHNVDVLAGELKGDERRAINVIYKSGVVISMAFGYAWE